MKKIILLLAFSVTLFSTAQSTYLIQKPLRLETVNTGSKSDSVLVRGADKIVKFVPRTDFSGTIPNLDQVLGRGQNAMDHTIYLMSSGDHYAAYGPFGYTIFNQSENSRLDFSDYEISKKNGNYEFHLSFNRDPLNTTFNYFLFPQKSSGSYILATTSDIITYSPVSNNTPGIVDNTPLQELGGVDKLINGIRIGKGSGTTIENIMMGVGTLGVNTTGEYNTAMGYEALMSNTTGNNNTAIGEWALRSNTTANSNTAVGVNSLKANTTGTWNVSVGVNSMNSSVNGHNNVAVGGEALKKNVGGTSNVAVGISSLRDNVGIAESSTNGCHNTALGNSTLIYNVSGAANTAIGSAALARVMSGEHNIGIGYQGGSGITGSRNVVIATSGWVVGGGGITTGNNNMVLAPNNGDNTGITTGSGNIVLGKVTGLSPSASNTITISDGVGNIAITKSTTGELKTPNLTQALIISGGASSLVNKGYVDNTGAVDNATTTSLSSATLTTTYPNALSGFRVRCLNITGGALTYEKTASGWIQYAISITQ